ncbi:co-chaperone protein daf-41-like [Paramacrobiotus metropolitanus]|uniref:co-chaperone protein daf-41-like n=1 Tax=Paramacrobiotus metropolitanus TaxID=2943436 RepID=UPI0024456C92|nr:co-chaperone protein daf-41-like [Paramacrobiotus metropolitanus]
MPDSGKANQSAPAVPQVLWAQRKDIVLLSIMISDVKDQDVKMTPEKVHFSGTAGPDQKPYALDVELYAEIDPEKSQYVVRDRLIDFKLQKKDTSGKFWPRLLKSTGKAGWLKTDFSRWKDEDEEDDEERGGMGGMGDFGGFGGGGGDLESMMQQMGGGGMNMGGMGDESDDESPPDLEKKEGEHDSDDDMPKLE